MLHNHRPIWTALLLLVTTLLVGTFAYHIVERWSLLDSFYMVVITLSTVGFREVHELTPAGQVITMMVILFGLVSLSFLIGGLSRAVLEGELRRALGARRMEREVSRARDHFIVCGYGRVGRVVCQELAREGSPLVVIDADESMIERIERDGHPVVKGDATEEATLQAAGIERAAGLILALPEEADNVYVTLLAKDLFPDLFVLARGISDNGERRLRAAGADRIVSPNIIGGHRIAQAVLRPRVVDFVDNVTSRRELAELLLEELQVGPDSPLSGQTIGDSDIRQNYGLMVVAILRPDGAVAFNPSPREKIDAGVTLIVLGRREDLDRFDKAV